MIHLNVHPPPQHIKNESLFLYPERQRQCTLTVSACLCHCTVLVLSGSLTPPDRRNIKTLCEGNSAQSKLLVQQCFLGTRFWYRSIFSFKVSKPNQNQTNKEKKDPLKSRLIERVLTLVRQMSDMQQACGFSSKVKRCFLHNGMINTLRQEY